MFWRIVRTRGVIPLLLILAALAYWRLHPHIPKAIETGYVGERTLTLWNTLAQVRQPLADLHYGDRVEVVREEGTSAQVRMADGALGWVLDSRQIMDSDLWGQSAALLAQAQAMPVQARGHTKTVSNLRIEPGRNGKRVFQFPRGTPVVVLERRVAEAQQAGDENSNEEKTASSDEQKAAQREDWLLVMRATDAAPSETVPATTDNSTPEIPRSTGDPVSGGARGTQPGATAAESPGTPIAGWVLARFIEPDLPGPVRDYASSADLHVVAWFVLNRVPDGSGGEAPQYLVAGTRGGEGQDCDFTMLRVYTWGTARMRYETAYIESNLCGRLPIRVTTVPAGPEFRFAEADDTHAERTYVMRQTSVQLVKDKSSGPSSSRRSLKH